MLALHKSLLSLKLSDNKVGATSLLVWINSSAGTDGTPCLVTFQISGASMTVLAGALGVNSSLKHLDVSNNIISGDSVGALCAVLGWNPRSLAQFEDPGDKSVNMTLTELFFDGNALGEEGGRWLGLAMGCWSINILSVKDCALADGGAVKLLEGLGTRDALGSAMKSVRLGENGITEQGLRRGMAMLREKRAAGDGERPQHAVLEVLDITGSRQDAIKAAMEEMGVEGLGIRAILPAQE